MGRSAGSTAYVALSSICTAATAARGHGIGTAIRDKLEGYYGRSDVDFIEVRSHEDGGYTLDRPGLAWDPQCIDSTFAKFRSRIDDLIRTPGVRAADEQVLREMQHRIRVRFSDQDVPRLEGSQKWPTLKWPTPNELAEMISRDLSDPELGRRLMRESSGTIFPLSEKGRHYGI